MSGVRNSAGRRVARSSTLLVLLLSVSRCQQDPNTYLSPLDRLRADRSLKVREQLFAERQPERDAMVDEVIRKAKEVPITEPAVISALRRMPRHAFLTGRHLVENRAYIDRPISIGYGFQTISNPSIVAVMMQLLKIRPGEKVLEIGTGSGYQAALLAEITPHVYTIEIIKGLAHEGADRLRLLGYDKVQARAGDGYYGWQEAAPFEAIIVTCAAGHIPPPLLAQLVPGGRMVIPVGNPYQIQRLILVTKDADGKIKTEDRMPVRFVAMTGAVQASTS